MLSFTVCQVVEKTEAFYQGDHKYAVNLYCYDEDNCAVSISDLLIRRGLALPSDNLLQVSGVI